MHFHTELVLTVQKDGIVGTPDRLSTVYCPHIYPHPVQDFVV
jgi:hypothetical protein